MTGVPAEAGTIFMFERKTLWLSDMQGKTNWLRIWGIITCVEVLGELGHFLMHPSVPKPTSVETNNITMPGTVTFNISHTFDSSAVKTSDMLTTQENNIMLIKEKYLAFPFTT